MYNAEESVIKALNSVKFQTYDVGEFEVVVINDGSTDGSKILVENYIKDNPEINIQLINQLNSGVSKARNTGLKLAKGDYIALLDADDEWYPQKTERQMNVLENENFEVDFLGCRRKNHEILYPYNIDENNLAFISFRKLMFRNETQPSTVIFKSKVLKNLICIIFYGCCFIYLFLVFDYLFFMFCTYLIIYFSNFQKPHQFPS